MKNLNDPVVQKIKSDKNKCGDCGKECACEPPARVATPVEQCGTCGRGIWCCDIAVDAKITARYH